MDTAPGTDDVTMASLPELALVLLVGADAVSRVDSNSDLAANPIRKVVNMSKLHT